MAEAKRKRQPRKQTKATSKQIEEAKLVVGNKLKDNPDIYNLPVSKYELDMLVKHYVSVEGDKKLILPLEKRRYVIYLRKSTDSEDRQVRSIPDQKAECLFLAKNLGITVRDGDLLEEHESAKVSGKRPVFDKMLQGFRTGKYHGLLVWSPHRLSRAIGKNMEVFNHSNLCYLTTY